MQKQPVQPKQVSVLDEADSWIEAIMTPVWEMLDGQHDGSACITTPSGRACYVTVRFATGGSA